MTYLPYLLLTPLAWALATSIAFAKYPVTKTEAAIIGLVYCSTLWGVLLLVIN